MPDQTQNPGETEGKNLPPAEESEKDNAVAEDADLEMPADYERYIAGGMDCTAKASCNQYIPL